MTHTDVMLGFPNSPPHPGCVLNILLHSSSNTHTYTRTLPRNCAVKQHNAESNEGSEVFSWAKPPQPLSDELTWVESMPPLEPLTRPVQQILSSLLDICFSRQITRHVGKEELLFSVDGDKKHALKKTQKNRNRAVLVAFVVAAKQPKVLLKFTFVTCFYSPQTGRKLAVKNLWRSLLLHSFSCERQQRYIFYEGLQLRAVQLLCSKVCRGPCSYFVVAIKLLLQLIPFPKLKFPITSGIYAT